MFLLKILACKRSTYDAEAGIFREKQVHTIGADALASSVTRLSQAIMLTI